MGWASGFRAGSDVARQAINTYQDARQRRDFDQIANAKPEESQGYTAADGAQMEAMSKAIDPSTGKPYYDIQDNGRGGLQVRNNFAYQGPDGQKTEPGSVTGLDPRRVTDFMGTRTEGTLSPQGIDAARGRAYADAISRTDPIKGLQMKRDATNQERDDIRFADERRLQPMKERAAQLQISSGERSERVGVRSDKLTEIDDQIAQMPDEALAVYAAKINTNDSNVPLLYVGQNKQGFQFLTRDPKTGEPGTKPMTYNASQLRDLARVSVYAMTGFGKESQALLKDTSKELHDMLYKTNAQTAAIVQSSNDATAKGLDAENNAQRTADAKRRTNIAAGVAGTAKRDLQEYVDEKGNVVVIDRGVLPKGEGGVLRLPPGLRPKTARPEFSIKDVREYATELQGSVNIKTGKPYTPEQAMAESRRILSGQEDPFTARLNSLLGDGSDPFAPAPARTQGMSTTPAPAAPRRQIGTIVPPRSAADMAPKPAMSDNDIILNYLSR